MLWALIAMVGFTGVLGPYLLPHDIFIFLSSLLGGDYVHQGPVLAQLPVADIGHRVFGLLLLITGMLQFDHSLRLKRQKLHRWMGRIFLLMVATVVITALVLGLTVPFSGPTESIFVLTVCLILGWFSSSAWLAVRRRDFVAHREWMIRTLGICFFITVQRLIYMMTVVATDWPDRELFILSNWMGVVIVLIAAEAWISITRGRENEAG